MSHAERVKLIKEIKELLIMQTESQYTMFSNDLIKSMKQALTKHIKLLAS